VNVFTDKQRRRRRAALPCESFPITGGRRSFGAVLIVALGIIFPTCTHAGELLAARMRIKPERPYVTQPFEVRLEVEVTPGAQVQDMQLEGVPLDTFAKLSTYQNEERHQARRNDRTVDVLAFVATGRAIQPTRQEFHGTLHANLVERHSLGFFTSLSSAFATIHLDPLLLEFRPLPTVNVPPGFQGAIGSFLLSGNVDPPLATPNDLVTLTYTITGNGWLGDAQILLPSPDPNFRVYPPQETQRDDIGHLKLQQVIVPLNTNATHIGMARLPYFDPVAGVYRESTAGPFHLALTTAPTSSPVPPVKHLDVQPNPAAVMDSGDAAVAVAVNQARQLLPFAGVILLAVLAAGLLYEWRPRLAIAAGVVLLIAGLYLCQHGCNQSPVHGRETRALTDARLCPSANARILFHIAPGRQVTPLEDAEDWVRVDANGQRGWIPVQALKP